MAALAELWALIGHLPHDPLGHLILAAQILRPEAPRLLGDVHHDRARLEHRDRRAAALWSMVDHRRHAVVRVHLQKFGRELIAALDVAGDDLVLKPAFFQQDGDFLAVGGRPVMQIEHRKTPALLRASDSPCATLAQHKWRCLASGWARRRAAVQLAVTVQRGLAYNRRRAGW